jgi:hypothetical protein
MLSSTKKTAFQNVLTMEIKEWLKIILDKVCVIDRFSKVHAVSLITLKQEVPFVNFYRGESPSLTKVDSGLTLA